MSIHLYTACWNEEQIIPFFLRHYEPLVDRIVVYDDGSTDRSAELLRASPKVEVRTIRREADSFFDAHMTLFETCWQESRGRADWVCLVDLDEFLFQPDFHRYLAVQREAGVTLIKAVGYEMVSEDFPPAGATLANLLTRGIREHHLDKTALFAPDAIQQMNHSVGRHLCSPVGRLVPLAKEGIQLRHFKNLGLDYLLARTHALAGRLTSDDLARGWSTHYLRDDDFIRAEFQKQLALAQPVPPPRVPKPKKEPKKKSWWRRLISKL